MVRQPVIIYDSRKTTLNVDKDHPAHSRLVLTYVPYVEVF